MDRETLLARLAAPRPPLVGDLRPWLCAAAVLDTFDPAALRPVGDPAGEIDREALKVRSEQLKGGRWRLRASVRAAQLRELQASGVLAEARAANPGESTIRQRLLDAWLSGEPVAWQDLPAPELRIAAQVLKWLESLPLPRLPYFAELEGRLRYLERREPLASISAGFRDRSAQLSRLRKYMVQGARPLMVYGTGGSGKSALIARFLLEVDQRGDCLWAYLDLDDDSLDAGRASSLLAELLRQLAEQRTEFTSLTKIIASNLRSPPGGEREGGWESGASGDPSLRELERALPDILGGGRLLVVVDTFEEAQLDGRRVTQGVVALARRLIAMHPGVRVLISGRLPVGGIPRLKVGDLPTADAAALVRDCVRAEFPLADEAIAALIERAGRSPLTVLLLADALNRILQRSEAPLSLLADIDALSEEVQGEQIQGFLYMRLLGHLRPDPDLHKLAHASLALPAFDRELLAEVVAPLCRIDPGRVDVLVEDLQREISFVEKIRRSQGWMRHRADLRERVEPYLERSLAGERVDLRELRRIAQASVEARRHRLEPRILALYQGQAVTAGGSDAALSRALALLEQGDPRAAATLLEGPGRIGRSGLGAMALARSYHALGQKAEAATAARRAMGSPGGASESQLARFSAWIADHLDDTALAVRAFPRRGPQDAVERLRVMAAVEAAQARTQGVWSGPSEQLLAAWDAVGSDLRAAEPLLVARLAGLLGEERRRAILMALSSVGLPQISEEDQEILAEGLRESDLWLAGAGDRSGSLILGLLGEPTDPGGEVDLAEWRFLLQARGGSDPADLLQKLLYSLKNQPPPLLAAIAQVYRSRDARRLAPLRDGPPPDNPPLGDTDLQIPKVLQGKQLTAVHNVMMEVYTPEALHRLAARTFGAEAIASLSWSSSRAHTSSDLLQWANRRGLIRELIAAMLAERPSSGLEHVLRSALAG